MDTHTAREIVRRHITDAMHRVPQLDFTLPGERANQVSSLLTRLEGRIMADLDMERDSEQREAVTPRAEHMDSFDGLRQEGS